MEIRLCAFADEASKEFERQLDVLNEENIPYIELRGLDGTNVSDLTEEQAREYKKSPLTEYIGFAITRSVSVG